MKIITWNLRHNKSNHSWDYAYNNLDGDIYIFQESFHPLTYLDYEEYEHLKNNIVWEPTVNGWGTSIWSKTLPIAQVRLENSFKGRLVFGKLTYSNLDTIIIIGLHTPITKNYSRYNLQKMFEESSPLLSDYTCIVAGDINFGKCFDKFESSECYDILQTIINQNKLINCYSRFHSSEKQTFRPPRKPNSPIHIDYIFCSEKLSKRLKHCDVLCNDKIIKLSDHNPVYAIIE